MPKRDGDLKNVKKEWKFLEKLTMDKPSTSDSKFGSAKSKSSVSSSSSTAVRKKQLEFEAAQAKAKVQLEAAAVKAKVETELIEKKLEFEIAELESLSSEKSSGKSYKSEEKVEEWLENGHHVEAPEISFVEREIVCNNKHELRAEHQDDRVVRQLADALRDAMTITASTSKMQNEELLTRLATSKDLPLYFGDPMEWLQFREAFNESTKLCRYSETENVWRLRKCLRGEAKEAVSSLLIGGTSPNDIIETLELRFGRPETIMCKIVAQLKKLHPLPHAYHNDIVNFSIKIKNYVAAAISIKQNDYLRSPELVNLVVSKLPTALVSKWADHAYECRGSEKAKLELIADFLHKEATKAAAAGVSHIQSQMDFRRKPDDRRVHSVLFNNGENDKPKPKCMFCRGNIKHSLNECARFKRAMRKDRWRFVRINKLCYKCLGSRHDQQKLCAAPNCDIDECGQPHHPLLHWLKPKPKTDQGSGGQEEEPPTPEDTVAHTVLSRRRSIPKVLLKVVPVTIDGPRGSVSAYALLDDGATVSLISASLADKAGLHGESVTMRARSAWDSAELVCQTETVKFKIRNGDGKCFNVNARKMRELNLPRQKIIKPEDLNGSGQLSSSDNSYLCDVQPELLIGQDNYDLIAPIKCIKGKQSDPYLTKTSLGWCVHGTVCTISDDVTTADRLITPIKLLDKQAGYTHDSNLNPISHASMNQFANKQSNDFSYLHTSPSIDSDKTSLSNGCFDMQLNDLVRQSFALDSIGIISKPRSNPDDLRAVAILNNTAELTDGQWTVGLPWKSDDVTMPESYPNAYSRLRSVERKMSSDAEYASRYAERIHHLLNNDYAMEIEENMDVCTSNRTWYLPHFGVDNPNKKKLRLVYDAAAKSNGFSLNDFLLQGPDLLQSLFGIMLRFREQPVGIMGDIKDMFLRIKIREEDRHALRFLWREKNEPVKRYVMTSLIFGANCSPFIAQYINQQKNTERFLDTLPEAVNAIRRSQYMDDYIDSLPDDDLTVMMMKDVAYIHQQGGFEMRNWMSNSPYVLENVPKEMLSEKAVRFNMDGLVERTLGLLWYPASDVFAFDLSFKRIPKDVSDLRRKPTKREMLRLIMSIYDIHGFLAPLTVKAKILMQIAWKTDIEWDQELPNGLYLLFCEWFTQLRSVCELRIPRWYFRQIDPLSGLSVTNAKSTHATSENGTSLELHVFCDASPCAYAAVAYWRKQCKDNVCVSFIASKNRVAPLKPVSIPRLELQGALVACRLAETIKKEHRISPTKTFYWTDSTTVLYWIKNKHKQYKTFISHRLSEIDSLSNVNEWYYIPTDMNIADVATKKTSYILTSDCDWLCGPSFLYNTEQYWPHNPEMEKNVDETNLEKINIICLSQNDLPVPDASRFSSLLRLLRSMVLVLVFINECRKTPYQINSELFSKAKNLILRRAQMDSFEDDINKLKNGNCLDKSSRLLQLTPFIDEDGLLRVGGRINAVQGVSTDVKQPVILDGHHPAARLIVKHYHIMAAHGHNEMVVNELRQKYWVLKLRPTVRSVASACCFCRIRKAQPQPPRMGDLPCARLQHHKRAFTSCGIDLFGPLEITVGRRRAKRYGVLFTCLTVRAVHIELVSSLTADSLIMALRRMAARRGWPRIIYSDNGTNLRGAEAELKRSLKELDKHKIQTEALNKGVDWNFISPVSPHMGGAWERMIRSVKTALKVVLNERAPQEETLITLLAEVENIVNSRPLTHVSVDPRCDETLTPNHFLLGSSSNLPVPGVFDDGEIYSRRQWRIAQRLTDLFWSRWMKEVLPTLLPRQKWNSEAVQLKQGDLVVVVDPSSPRNVWPKGIITATYPGEDGRVRVVDIKTKTGVMKRPAVRVALLSRGNECRTDTRGEDVSDGHSAPF